MSKTHIPDDGVIGDYRQHKCVTADGMALACATVMSVSKVSLSTVRMIAMSMTAMSMTAMEV